jgi:hypothetical protein
MSLRKEMFNRLNAHVTGTRGTLVSDLTCNGRKNDA